FRRAKLRSGSEVIRSCHHEAMCTKTGMRSGYWTELYQLRHSDKLLNLIELKMKLVVWFSVGNDKEKDANVIRKVYMEGRSRLIRYAVKNSADSFDDLDYIQKNGPSIRLFEAEDFYSNN